MIAGFFQFSPERGRPEQNAARLEEALRSTKADLLVCPELATTGYLYLDREELRAVAEPVPSGPTVTRLAQAARETKRAIVFGIAERAGEKIYNSAVAIQGDDRLLGIALPGAAGRCGNERHQRQYVLIEPVHLVPTQIM